MNRPPVCLDLCCGLGGWAEGFLDAGYLVVGYDVKDWGYPGYLVIQDVREVEAIASYWRGQVDVMVASPPCNEVSLLDLPWGRRKNLPPPDLSIFEACFMLRELIQPKIFLLENVRGAQVYIGRAPLHRKAFYFWGDVALVPECPEGHYKTHSLAYAKRSSRPVHIRNAMARAKIPYQIAYGFALACKP